MITKCALVVGHRLSAKGATNKKLFSQESSLTFEDFGNFNIYLQNFWHKKQRNFYYIIDFFICSSQKNLVF